MFSFGGLFQCFYASFHYPFIYAFQLNLWTLEPNIVIDNWIIVGICSSLWEVEQGKWLQSYSALVLGQKVDNMITDSIFIHNEGKQLKNGFRKYHVFRTIFKNLFWEQMTTKCVFMFFYLQNSYWEQSPNIVFAFQYFTITSIICGCSNYDLRPLITK